MDNKKRLNDEELENEKTKKTTVTNVYTYNPGEYDVLIDTSLEDKIEEFRKDIDKLDDCYKEISKRLESLDGNGVWKSENQKELYSYLKQNVVSTFNKRIENWKVFREFLITVLQSYTEFDSTYDKSIDDNKTEFDVNENKEKKQTDNNN